MSQSESMLNKSSEYLLGGVGSDERADVEPQIVYAASGSGSRFADVDGNQYIDWQMGYGALILGHAPLSVGAAIKAQVDRGWLYGMPHELEYTVSKRLVELIPSLEVVRYVQSGSEAVSAALRVARAHTGKSKVVKFEGHYHGWLDQLHISHLPPVREMYGARSGGRGVLQSAGQASSVLRDVIVLPWNDIDRLEHLLIQQRHDIAAVLMEPIMFNASCILPKPGYLEAVRKLTADLNIVLIFDEVHTGFRVGLGGAQAYLDVTPDLTVLAKAMGAGVPVACFGGSRELMEDAAQKGARLQGTYNSNPLVLAAVDATITELSRDDGAAYRQMARLASRLRRGLVELYHREGWSAQDQGPPTGFSVMLNDRPLHEARDLYDCDTETLSHVRRLLRERHVYTRPSLRDMWYFSAAHTDADVDETLQAVEDSLATMRAGIPVA